METETNGSIELQESKSLRSKYCAAAGIILLLAVLLYVGSFIPTLWIMRANYFSLGYNDTFRNTWSFIYAPILRIADYRPFKSPVVTTLKKLDIHGEFCRLNRDRAAAILAIAREELKRNRFESARKLANRADSIEVTYSLFDDRPDLILADIARIETQIRFTQQGN